MEDFTVLPEGTFVPIAGLVRRCPRCERTGVETFSNTAGSSMFIHVQTCDVIGDGMCIDVKDGCAPCLPDVPFSLSLVACRT